MTTRRVVPREQARRDIEEAIDHYVLEAGEQVALRFIDAIQSAYQLLGDHPAAGSNRYAHELGLPGLRSWPVTGFLYLIFYVEAEDRVDIWRVLHGQRDIPAWLQEGD